MAKLAPKAIVKPFAADELNPDFQPTRMGDYASEGAITRSYDPEVLLERSAEGLSVMTVKTSDGKVILPPSGDIAGLEYSITYCLKALQQSGIAEYTSKQDYHLNDIVKAPSGFKIYRSLDNDNIGNPLTNSSKWEELDLLALKQATTSQRGTLQIATTSDINTGTNNTKALTVANLRASNINFTGSPTAPTQATSDNSKKLANTEYVKSTLSEYINNAIKNSTPPIITVNSNTNIVYSAFSVFSKNGTMLLSFAGGTVAPDIAIPNTSFSAIYPWIVSVDGITTQIKCTTNANTPPTGFAYYKRIGSFVSRNGNLRTGTQYGNKFIFSARVDDYNSAISNNTIPVSIPPIPVIANLTGIAYLSNGTGVASLSINGYVVSASGSSSGANGAGYFASLHSSTGTFLLQGSINIFSIAVSSYEDLTLL